MRRKIDAGVQQEGYRQETSAKWKGKYTGGTPVDTKRNTDTEGHKHVKGKQKTHTRTRVEEQSTGKEYAATSAHTYKHREKIGSKNSSDTLNKPESELLEM